ncbi:hypothetical protein P691DRAFT_773849 [Macrolepiota fuliginosa MF-IS2]|uniref:VWFA domain-containing protein n=1 Tax=Macrolepiota fuliginosa MF-IS2 TaxID=1400762 RepID=A0A9P6C6N6_9AGAR|nr:hypothetical protein P691DRAFT_773849 [Macrolepiota fuliginosa MF-IS2]
MKPRADTVNPGYNPKLDEQRPTEMVDYLKDYRILFVIDDSASMSGDRWREARDALSEIAEHALRYHSDAIDIRFFNNQYKRSRVKGTREVRQTFNYVSPSGGTPTGHVLEEVLDQQIDRLDIARKAGGYTSEPPLDIIVLTDGVPSHNSPPAPVIEVAAKRLKDNKHHPNVIGIQFVQIGNDPAAEPTLLSLINGPNNDMVDTISYSLYAGQAPDGKLTSNVLERIILGGLHPNLRAYWNQHQQRS